MKNLVKVENINVVEMTSNQIAELTGKRHPDVMRDVRNLIISMSKEDDADLRSQKDIIESTYINKQNKVQPNYILSKDGIMLLITGYSVIHRMKLIKYCNELENKLNNKFPVPTTFKEALLLAVKQQEQIEQLEIENAKKDKEIIYKEDVIIGLVDDIDLSTKRQRITQIINKGAKRGNYSDRWNILYREFEKKYHLNLRARIDKCQISPKVKNKIDYIERVLEMIPQLYELTCKIFENDVEKLKHEWFDNI